MCVRMRKPWHQWVEQLFSDESVEAQCDALRGLIELPLPFDAKNSEARVHQPENCGSMDSAVGCCSFVGFIRRRVLRLEVL